MLPSGHSPIRDLLSLASPISPHGPDDHADESCQRRQKEDCQAEWNCSVNSPALSNRINGKLHCEATRKKCHAYRDGSQEKNRPQSHDLFDSRRRRLLIGQLLWRLVRVDFVHGGVIIVLPAIRAINLRQIRPTVPSPCSLWNWYSVPAPFSIPHRAPRREHCCSGRDLACPRGASWGE